jgi:tRNA-dihydrouridine synthase B
MNYWNESLKIGKFSFPRFIGGPLDGITDSPFRKLVREFSKDELLYTEMRHVGCIANDRGKTKSLEFDQLERPLNYQIAANKIDFIQRACERILEAGVDMVDLNVGCPANNVIGSGSGSALMADLPRLTLILKTLRQTLPVPFTVKIRAGFKCQNALEVAKLIQDCGADALAIHPRLQTQKFEGRPDYALVADVKKAMNIPVIVSGGIVNWATAKMVYEQTGVDGFLIGRGIWGKPWKLQELRMHANNEAFEITHAQMMQYAVKHVENLIAYYGPHGLFMFRKHLPFYLRGFHDASLIRQKLVTSTSIDEIKDTFLLLMEKPRA